MSVTKVDTVLRQNVSIEWEIKEFYNLPKTHSYFLDSPYFKLCNAGWNIRIYPNRKLFRSAPGWISLFLKKNSGSKVRFHCTMGIKATDGSVFQSFSSNNLSFREGNYQWGEEDFLRRSQLLMYENVVAPDGMLSVFLTVHILDGDTAGVEVAGPYSSSDGRFILTSELNAYEERIKHLEEKLSAARKKEADFDEPKEKIQELEKGVGTLSQNFKELFLSGHQSDFTLKVKDKDFKVHKLILSARSPVFRAMFEVDMAEKNSGNVDIQDCEPKTFEDFLLFLYSGKFDVVSPDNALGLYVVAEKYQVNDLKKPCFECISRNITVECVCDVVHLATLHNENELLNTATEFFVNNIYSICSLPQWLSFFAEHPTIANELILKSAKKFQSPN